MGKVAPGPMGTGPGACQGRRDVVELGVIVKWGKLVPGREEKAVEVFGDAIAYFGELLAAKRLTSFEPYMYQTSDLDSDVGFFIFKGPQQEIFKMFEEDKFLMIREKAFYTVEHLKIDLLTVGEGISSQLERSAKARAELGVGF